MTRYDKADEIESGTKVLISKPGPYGGKIGEVVETPFGRNSWSELDPAMRMTWVKIPGRATPFGFYTNNLERIEEMTYNKNLVGPKPEPVQEPKHPTPWRYSGRRILDANGGVVFIVRQTARTEAGMVLDIDMSTVYELARVVTDAVNEKFAPSKAQDSPSPF